MAPSNTGAAFLAGSWVRGTQNTAPGKPAALEVTSKNPNRYLDRFGAKRSLPPNSGSPIKRVLDAVLCALIARAAALGLTEPPAPDVRELARIEGWIHLPHNDCLGELAVDRSPG